jgi:protein-tyrosine sulfotransferase
VTLAGLLGYRRRWQLLALVTRRARSRAAPIVVGGCHRSGTTLLRVLLDRHPKIAAGAESTVFLRRISSPCEIGGLYGLDPELIAAWQLEARSQVAFIERFQAAVLAAAGKPIWAEKTPGNVLRFGFVRRHFPDARLVHIIRDGRDVVCSLRRARWPKPCGGTGSGEELRRCAEYWARYVRSGRRFAGDPRYFELRYEALARDPEPALRRLLRFVGLEWDASLLRTEHRPPGDGEKRQRGAIDAASVGRWQEELLPLEKQIVCEAVGDLLVELGYAADDRWAFGAAPQPAARGAARAALAKRWTRAERLRIEAVAAWRTLGDPRLRRRPLAAAAQRAPALLRVKRRAVKRHIAALEAAGRPTPGRALPVSAG